MHQPGTIGLLAKRPEKTSHPLNLRAYKSKSKGYLFAKRGLDVGLSLFLILTVFWWLFPILAILIKLDSRGPVFFVQKRTGLFGFTFSCLKFRTMVVNAYADTRQAEKNDPRITRFGNFLRLTCLDELPQFFNVLLGDMSIVGPRPHMISDCESFSSQVQDYNLRQLMRPGITGMAQVKGYRGKTKGFYDVFHRYQWDVFYVRNANFMLDVKIIHKTILQTLSAIIKLPRRKEASEGARVVEFKNA